MRNIIMFDVDGTLIDVTPVHVRAYQRAFKKVTGITIEDPAHLTREFGKPEALLMESVLKRYGISAPTRTTVQRLIREYTISFAASAKTITSANLLPGVLATLKRLKKEKKTLVAISGNPKALGDILLERTGIRVYFDATAYSTEKWKGTPIRHRHEILQLGLSRVLGGKKQSIAPNQILVVGDTPSDIVAAKKIGIDCLAVATGRYTLEELAAFHPRFVVRNFTWKSANHSAFSIRKRTPASRRRAKIPIKRKP